MSLEIITGHRGIAHITSQKTGLGNAGVVGTGKYIYNIGSKFSYSLLSNNSIRIGDGIGINQGVEFSILPNDYEDLTIDTGIAGLNRHDLIVAKYQKNLDTDIESCTLTVIKGTSAETASDPTYESGNILDGDTEDDMLLYRVVIEGINVTSIVPLFSEINNISELESRADLIEEFLTTTTSTCTNGANYSTCIDTTYWNYLRKNGNIVELNIAILTKAISSGAEYTIFEIPTGYRPANNFQRDYPNLNNSAISSFRFNSDGTLKILVPSTLAGGTQIRIHESWII